MVLSARKFVEKLGMPPGTLVYVGDRKPDLPRFTLMHINNGSSRVESFESWTPCEASMKALKDGYIWLHMEGLADVKSVEAIGKCFNIHHLALEDVLNTHHRPKMTDFENFVQFLFRLVLLESRPGDLNILYEQGAVIVGSNFVLSFQERRNDFFSKVRHRCHSDEGKFSKYGPTYLAFALMDYAVDHYYSAVGRIDTALDELESRVLKDRTEKYLDELYDLKWEVTLLKKIVVPMRDYNKSLLKSPPILVSEDVQIYFRDLDDHLVQVVDVLDSLKETVNSLFDISDSYAAHRRNMVMAILTAVSVIFLPLNFLAGVFGMNFSNMPLLHHDYGFYIACGFMGFITLLLLLAFKSKRWL